MWSSKNGSSSDISRVASLNQWSFTCLIQQTSTMLSNILCYLKVKFIRLIMLLYLWINNYNFWTGGLRSTKLMDSSSIHSHQWCMRTMVLLHLLVTWRSKASIETSIQITFTIYITAGFSWARVAYILFLMKGQQYKHPYSNKLRYSMRSYIIKIILFSVFIFMVYMGWLYFIDKKKCLRRW